MVEDTLTLRQILAYSLGHVQNDLMSAMWFSYLLVYLDNVRRLDAVYVGTLMMIGQIVDGVVTPLVGFESDATNGCFSFGKRKSWHAFGTLCTTLAFPFIFSPVLGATRSTPEYAVFVYYLAFVVVGQIGWACVQVAHLSLIPELTSNASEIAGLNGWRYAGTGLANLLAYGLVWAVLSSGGSNVDPAKLTAADSVHFRNLGIVLTAIGLVFSFIFHIGVPESKDISRKQTRKDEDTNYGSLKSERSTDGEVAKIIDKARHSRRSLRVCDWLKDPRFYQVALTYTCTRSYVNISQVYLPIYLTETLHLDKVTIANVPLVCYTSSFLIAVIMKKVDNTLGRMPTYMTGVTLALVSAIFLYFIPVHQAWIIYVTVVFVGAGWALMLSTALSIVADLIGDSVDSGAFVYGAVSFAEKIANGVAVQLVQVFHPCKKCCPACGPYFRSVQSFIPGGAALIGLLALLSLNFNFFTTWRGIELKVGRQAENENVQAKDATAMETKLTE